MMMKNKMIRALGLSAVAVGLTVGVANAETITGTVQVTVLSSINIVETTPMTFGTLAVFGDYSASTDVAVLTLPADGSATSVVKTAKANIVEIAAGTPALFSITGAAPNTGITVLLPGDTGHPQTAALSITDPAGGTDTFALFNFTRAIVTSGTAFTYDTDGTGTLEFAVGADLTTNGVPTAGTVLNAYADSTYTGTYDVIVSY